MSIENAWMDTAKSYTTAAAQVATIKTGAGYLMSLQAFNVNGATRWLWLFDATTSVVPVFCAPIQLLTGASVQIVFPTPKKFATALRWNASDTLAFHTSGGNDLIVTAQFY